MNDVLKFGKKLFTFSVVAVTIAWSMGLATLVPTMVHAVECPVLEAGDLYKVPQSSSVYYLNAEMESMYFPTEEVFFSWGFSFSDVKVIPNTCFDNYDQATPAGLNFRPGSRLVKRVESPTVYVVLPGNKRAAIGSEAVAAALYGANWAKLVRDLPGVFMSNFLSTGSAIDSAVPHNGQFIKEAGSTSVYYVLEGELYEVDGDVTSDVREVSGSVFAELAKSGKSVTVASIMEDPAQLGESTGETPVTVVGGDLKIALSANTPEAAVVPIDVDNVEFTKVIFTALDKAVTVNAIKIGRRGLGSTSDFNSITIYDQNGVRLGNTRSSWTSDGYMNYNISGGWTIPANSSRTITITANLKEAGKYNALGVENVTTNGGDTTGLGVYGNQMNGVSVTIGRVTITDQLTNATKKIGETDVQLAKFRLAVDSVEDAELKRITLKNVDTARDADIANMYLMIGSKVLARDADMVKGEVTFVLDEPYFIKKSSNETFTVYGDIVSGVNNKVEFTLKNSTDLVMTGKSYNTALRVDNSYTSGGEITIDGAELNISFTSVASDTLDDKTDVEFGTLTLSSGATDVEISEMTMLINKTSGAKSILDLEFVDTKTGAAYSGVTTTENATSQTWKFEDELYLESGKTYTFTVRGDIQDGVTNNHAYHLSMTINTSNLKATTEPAGDSVVNFSIGSFTGKKVTVKSPELKVSAANLASIDVTEGQEGVTLFETRMEAIADNVLIERMQFRGASNNPALFREDNWSELKLVSIIDGKEKEEQFLSNSVLADNSIDFDRLNFTIAKGKVATIMVKGNVSSVKHTSDVNTKIELIGVTAKDTRNNSAVARNVAGNEISTSRVISTLRTVSIKGTGILYVSMRNVDAGFNKDRVVLAGTEANVGKLRLRADYEDVRITKLVLTNSTSTSDRSVDEVCLYDGTTLVTCSILIENKVTFSNLDKVIEKGTKDWTIKVKTLNIGKNFTAASHDFIELNIADSSTDIEARGVNSGNELEGSDTVAEGKIVMDDNLNGTFNATRTGKTKIFVLAASRISNVASVNSYGGETVSAGINGTGTYTAMIFSVTTEANSNTDADGNAVKAVLDNVLLNVEKNASTTFSAATIKRIGGTVAAQALEIDGTKFVTSTSSVLGEDAKIDAGTTAYYVVKVTIDGLSTESNVTNWFQINMDNLKGDAGSTTNNIDWKDGNSTTKYDYLLLDAESVSGNRINAPQNN